MAADNFRRNAVGELATPVASTSPRERCTEVARLPRATFALMLALLPAAATVIGLIVLDHVPTWRDLLGVALVIAGVAAHQDPRLATTPK